MNELSNYLIKSLSGTIDTTISNLFESTSILNEGGRIQHAEDVIFWEGSSGAKRVLKSFLELQKGGYKNLTIKWDGSPAVIFGRNESGQFIFTDKNGFDAKSYNGKTTSPEDLEKMFLARGGSSPKSPSYIAFAGEMKSVFKVFESAVPVNFRGYFKGDLLYFKQPPIKDGKFIFKPNIVTYHVDVNSELGKNIARSISAVVIHRMVDETGIEKLITDFSIFQGDKLLVIPPITIQQAPKIDNSKIKNTISDVNKYGSSIDKMFDKSTLSKLKMVDFPELLYKYINSKVDTGLSDLGKDFEKWIESNDKLTDVKRKRVLEYIQINRSGFDGLWEIVTSIMEIKDDIITQIDQQPLPIKAFIGNTPSGEGYVLSNPHGDIKLVSRKVFSAANRALQRETIDEGGWLKPELTAKTKITPNIVELVYKNAEKFIKDFNDYLFNNGFGLITDFKILGSAKYYKQDIADKNSTQYGDIDVMFVLPEADDESQETKIKTLYSKLIVDFVKTSNQDYVDKESAERSNGKQLVIKIGKDTWAQVDLLYSFHKYKDWFTTRFSPERGLKGFVIGNLYSALAETLNIRISDRGVRAKLKDKQIVSPLLRKDTTEKLISTNPSTFLYDILVFLAEMFDVKYSENNIDSRLSANKGINTDDIKFKDFAIGVSGLIQTLDNTGILSKLNTTHTAFVNSIKSKYIEKSNENISFREKKVTDGDTIKNMEKIKHDAKVGQDTINRIINEFTEQFKAYIKEGGEAVQANSELPKKYLESTVTNGLKLYKLDKLKYEFVGNIQKELLGDIDIAVSLDEMENLLKASYEADKEDFYRKLDTYVKKNTPSFIPQPTQKVISGLDQVSIKVPIMDNDGNNIKSTKNPDEDGYVQLDLMIGDVDFMRKALSAAVGSKYKAAMRNLLLMEIMRYTYEPTNDPNVRKRYQLNWKKGLQSVNMVKNAKGKEDKDKNSIKTITNNMDDVAVFLFGQNHTFNDIDTFEKLFKLVNSSDFKFGKYKNEIIDDFKKTIKSYKYTI